MKIRHLTLVAAFGLLLGCQTRESDTGKNRDAKSDQSKLGGAIRNDKSSEVAASAISFEEITEALRNSVFQDGRDKQLFALPETTGGGMAFVDIDRDGRVDCICAGGGSPMPEEKQYIGNSGFVFRMLSDLRFVPVRESTCLDFSATFNSAVITADYDADGFQDVVMTGIGGLQMFRNQGDGTFESVSHSSGMNDKQWSSGAAFFDGDQDGLLDLYVVHYADWSFDNNPWCGAIPVAGSGNEKKRDYCGPREFHGVRDLLFKNLGDGSFQDISDASGISQEFRGLGVLAADLDGNRTTEIYVANDVDPNMLLRNEGSFKYDELGRRAGVACNDQGKPEGSMGVAVGDYNLDGKLDLWVTNYQNEIGALYRNNGNLSFTYASNAARIGATDEAAVGWGTSFCDFDLDGDEDLVCINGHVELVSSGSTFQQKPQFLENFEGKYFRLKRGGGGYLDTPQSGRGLALTDFNQDGLMDFGVCRINDNFAIVKNTTKSNGRYLELVLVGTKSNRDAIGTTVQLTVGTNQWVRCLYGGGSYASTSERVIHFGIPESAGANPGTLEIRWPSGIDQSVQIEKLNQRIMIVEGN